MELGQIRGKKIIMDSNVLVSYLVSKDQSRNDVRRLVIYAMEHSSMLISKELIEELEDVLSRSKFKQYFSSEDATQLISSMCFLSQMIDIKQKVTASRDSKDDKILEIALNGSADYLITGDKDLLSLISYGTTQIVSPKEFKLICAP